MAPAEQAPLLRTTSLWVTGPVSEDLAARLKQVGVDQLVVKRGFVDLTSRVPVVKTSEGPEIAGEIPLSVALRLQTGTAELGEDSAEALWNGLAPGIGSATGELILDLPNLAPGMPAFVRRLSDVSGLPVTPILTVSQLNRDRGLRTAEAARTVIVPVFGPEGIELRGVGEVGDTPIGEALSFLAGTGVRIRYGIVLTPKTKPELTVWGADLDPLCEGRRTDVKTDTSLGRAFVFRESMNWSGHHWSEGDRLDVQWIDAARLNRIFQDIDHIAIPEAAGWDLVSMAPPGGSLGIGRRALIDYLNGRGPGPDLDVGVRRSGRTVRLSVSNSGPFASVVGEHANWFEVTIDDGFLVAESRGDFERVDLGSRRGDHWSRGTNSRVNSVRFTETYVGPFESIVSGTIRMPSRRSTVQVRWHVTLSDGSVIEGRTNG